MLRISRARPQQPSEQLAMDQSMCGAVLKLGQSSLQIRTGGWSPHFDSISAPQSSGAFFEAGWDRAWRTVIRPSSRVLVESAVAVAPSALIGPGTRPCGVHEARVKPAAVSAGKLRVPNTRPSRGTRSPIRAMLFSRRFRWSRRQALNRFRRCADIPLRSA